MLKENIIKELEGFKSENRFRTIINYHHLHQD